MKIRDRSTLSLFDDAHFDARPTFRVWVDPNEPDADSFAGGGGASLGVANAYKRLGIERLAGRVAVNHWPEALAMYAANHPGSRIYCEDILAVDPTIASGGKRYAFAWFSPTCIFFSQARGAALDVDEATKVRGLADVAVDWAASSARPRVTVLENVKQFADWGPLHRQHSNGCSPEIAIDRGTVSKGKVTPKCIKGCCFGRPIKARKGEFFRRFVADLGKHYMFVTWRVLKAHHYGAPTSRERLFLVASDEEMRWPTPTHGPGLVPYRTAAECIDWTIECPSIFERAKALAEKTLARIRAGIERFVFGAARPFIVPATHGDKCGVPDRRADDVDEPLRTITTLGAQFNIVAPLVMKAKTYGGGGNDAKSATDPVGAITTSKRGEHAIATPVLVHRSNGERAATETTKAQAPRIYDVTKPITTLVAQGQKHGLALPILVKNYGERDGGFAGGQSVDRPSGAITQRDHHSLAVISGIKMRGTDEAHVAASPIDLEQPIDTIAASGTHFAKVAAFLVRYNGESVGQEPSKPVSTVDTRDRFALVTLTMERDVCDKAMRVAKFLGYDAPIVLELDGEQWVLVDIGFRMLTARELFLCQGFPPEYRIDIDFRGKPLTKTAQIKCCGNSVPPPLAEAVAMAAIATIRYEEFERRAA